MKETVEQEVKGKEVELGMANASIQTIEISQALAGVAGADHKDLMRKLPNFLYDEEKALERTRKKLEAKIAKLKSAIDNASAQIRIDDAPNNADVNSDEVEAAV
ncbi:hypothetical protein QQ045_013801 [Rhodiola kirilowii]